MKELSIFIDESGDFGKVIERPAYYLVTFVFHDQDNNIEQQVRKLDGVYQNLSIERNYGVILKDHKTIPGPNPMFDIRTIKRLK